MFCDCGYCWYYQEGVVVGDLQVFVDCGFWFFVEYVVCVDYVCEEDCVEVVGFELLCQICLVFDVVEFCVLIVGELLQVVGDVVDVVYFEQIQDEFFGICYVVVFFLLVCVCCR